MGALGLYWRTAAWGLATGAAAGGVVGAVVGVSAALSGELGFLPIGVLAGSFYGLAVALVPTLLGAVVVAAGISRRHPHPASEEAVQGDLIWLFFGLVGALNLLVFLLVLASGEGPAYIGGVIITLLVLDAFAAAMLHWAARHLSRAWAGSPERRAR
jgi:hypothetical protein